MGEQEAGLYDGAGTLVEFFIGGGIECAGVQNFGGLIFSLTFLDGVIGRMVYIVEGRGGGLIAGWLLYRRVPFRS